MEPTRCLGELFGPIGNLSPPTGRASGRTELWNHRCAKRKTVYASEDRGIDGGKKVKGHKRHIVVDILGNLLFVMVHAANLSDTKSACEVLERTVNKWSSLKAFSADAGYSGTAVTFCAETLHKPLHIPKKIKDGWAVLPKHWVVERTFSWLGNFRRLAKDVEILTATSENMIRIAMIKITLAKCV